MKNLESMESSKKQTHYNDDATTIIHRRVKKEAEAEVETEGPTMYHNNDKYNFNNKNYGADNNCNLNHHNEQVVLPAKVKKEDDNNNKNDDDHDQENNEENVWTNRWLPPTANNTNHSVKSEEKANDNNNKGSSIRSSSSSKNVNNNNDDEKMMNENNENNCNNYDDQDDNENENDNNQQDDGEDADDDCPHAYQSLYFMAAAAVADDDIDDDDEKKPAAIESSAFDSSRVATTPTPTTPTPHWVEGNRSLLYDNNNINNNTENDDADTSRKIRLKITTNRLRKKRRHNDESISSRKRKRCRVDDCEDHEEDDDDGGDDDNDNDNMNDDDDDNEHVSAANDRDDNTIDNNTNEHEYYERQQQQQQQYNNFLIQQQQQEKAAINENQNQNQVQNQTQMQTQLDSDDDDDNNAVSSTKSKEGKDTLGSCISSHDKRWDANFQLLVAYKKEYNSTTVPQAYKVNDLNLGIWVKRQRTSFKNKELSEERTKRLKSIGVVLKITKKGKGTMRRCTSLNDKRWNENFQLLVAYRNEYNSTTVPITYKVNDVNLGTWVNSQRRSFRRKELSIERTKRLKSLKFVWHTATYDNVPWMEMYQRLVAYKKQHKSTNVPKVYKIDPKFGSWVHNQRQFYKNKELSEERINHLESIGFVWNLRDEQWMEMYQKLVTYKKHHHGLTTVPQGYTEDPSLRKWVMRQRQVYNGNCTGILTKKRLELLNSINFTWSAE